MSRQRGGSYELGKAIAGVSDLHQVRNNKSNESVVRHTITQMLSDVYPPDIRPWWVKQQIQGAERPTYWVEDGLGRHGRADTIIGATAVEYESDLRREVKFESGKRQVAQYCAALLNAGVCVDDIIGVLSDGVEWYSYRLAGVANRVPGDYAVEDLELDELAHVITRPGDRDSVLDLMRFFEDYLARDEKAPLKGTDLAIHLGLNSSLGRHYMDDCAAAICRARRMIPRQATLVGRVWADFERYLSGGSLTTDEQANTYAREFYLSLVGRMICANVVAREPMRSADAELKEILRGHFFDDKGLTRFVEHDFFGWMNRDEVIESVLSIAREIQNDLRAFNFAVISDADVFGTLMSELAESTQRQLLGQEWTPGWLATSMARKLCTMLGPEEWPRFVDVCVGSGSMVAAVCRETQAGLAQAGIAPKSQQAVHLLTQAVTGFDIDPLAALLAGINWLVVNRDWLPLDGSIPISIPIYNADSLFALAPLWEWRNDEDEYDTLYLDGHELELPRFLVAPRFQSLFDGIVDKCAHAALNHVRRGQSGATAPAQLELIVSDAVAETGSSLDHEQMEQLAHFARSLADTLVELERSDRDGVWPFILRNSYRPGLVKGQFNGLITNPPWLAMSRIASNPFADVLERLARGFNLRPEGSTFLHLEMATVFLTYAAAHYLADGARIACVLPETMTTGRQYERLRRQLSGRDSVPTVRIRPQELWLVSKETFATLSSVLIATRDTPAHIAELASAEVFDGGSSPLTLYVAEFLGRFVWSEQRSGDGIPGGYRGGLAVQGADLMPRRLVGITLLSRNSGTLTFRSPARGEPDWYLLSDDKKHKEFSIPVTTLPARFHHKMWTSKHLTAFHLADPANIIIPAIRNDGLIQQADNATINAAPKSRRHFDRIIGVSDFNSVDDWWKRGLNMRSKLTNQNILANDGDFLVVYPASGEVPAANYVRIASLGEQPPLIDQTLYWLIVQTEDEAVYMCGLLNSPSLAEYIRPYLPEGAFGGRHLHTLPVRTMPKFDPIDAEHAEIVRATRNLIRQLNGARVDSGGLGMLDLNRRLQSRRIAARRLIESLPGYGEYKAACAKIYPHNS